LFGDRWSSQFDVNTKESDFLVNKIVQDKKAFIDELKKKVLARRAG